MFTFMFGRVYKQKFTFTLSIDIAEHWEYSVLCVYRSIQFECTTLHS